MTTVVACYKWVADEADVQIKSDFSVDISKAKGKISDYDKNAIETAVQAAATLGGKAVSLTLGNANAKLSLKDVLSRGPEEAYWINAEEAGQADGRITARALSAAIRKISDVKLVICAEGASDTYARQTAPRIGAVLDWPVITSVKEIAFEGNFLIASRKMDDLLETVKVELPAVIAVLPEINAAPIPGLKAVMSASKKPVTEFTSLDLDLDFALQNEVIALKGYVMDRKNIIFSEGEAQDKVNSLVANLRREGIV